MVFALQSCTQSDKQDDKNELISKLANTLKKHQSVHFKVDEKYYSTDVPDTTRTPFEVWAVRADSFIWADNKYRPYNLILSNDSFLVVIPPKHTTMLYPDFSEPMIGEHDWLAYFMNPDALIETAGDTNNRIMFSEIVLDGKSYAMLDIAFPKNDKGDKTTITYMIDRETAFPVRAKLVRNSPKNVYTNELSFSAIEYDKEDINELNERRAKVIRENPIEKRGESTTAITEQMLHEGAIAPLFDGKFYADGSEFRLQDYIGKGIILIDFWYTHCPPCVRGIPHISDFYKEMKGKGLFIFGLNSVDNQPRAMKNLKKFLNKREISYPIILTAPEVDKQYKIMGYPSMYVIGLDGKILEVEVGFDEASFDKMKEKIKGFIEEAKL
jgi:thiol-disulfide isomerase/thioredoxin